MTGEPMYTASKERMAPEVMFLTECAPQLSITNSKVKWLLCYAFSYRIFCFHVNINLHIAVHVTWFTQYASVQTETKKSVCSAHFTALQQMKSSRRSSSAINSVTTENTDDSHLQT